MKFTFRKYFENKIDDDKILEFLIKFEKKIRKICEIFNKKQIAKRVILLSVKRIDFLTKLRNEKIYYCQVD